MLEALKKELEVVQANAKKKSKLPGLSEVRFSTYLRLWTSV